MRSGTPERRRCAQEVGGLGFGAIFPVREVDGPLITVVPDQWGRFESTVVSQLWFSEFLLSTGGIERQRKLRLLGLAGLAGLKRRDTVRRPGDRTTMKAQCESANGELVHRVGGNDRVGLTPGSDDMLMSAPALRDWKWIIAARDASVVPSTFSCSMCSTGCRWSSPTMSAAAGLI